MKKLIKTSDSKQKSQTTSHMYSLGRTKLAAGGKRDLAPNYINLKPLRTNGSNHLINPSTNLCMHCGLSSSLLSRFDYVCIPATRSRKRATKPAEIALKFLDPIRKKLVMTSLNPTFYSNLKQMLDPYFVQRLCH